MYIKLRKLTFDSRWFRAISSKKIAFIKNRTTENTNRNIQMSQRCKQTQNQGESFQALYTFTFITFYSIIVIYKSMGSFCTITELGLSSIIVYSVSWRSKTPLQFDMSGWNVSRRLIVVSAVYSITHKVVIYYIHWMDTLFKTNFEIHLINWYLCQVQFCIVDEWILDMSTLSRNCVL